MPGPVLGAVGTQVIVCVRILCLVSEPCLGGVCVSAGRVVAVCPCEVSGVGIGEQQGGNLSPFKIGSDPALPQEQREPGQATDPLMPS